MQGWRTGTRSYPVKYTGQVLVKSKNMHSIKSNKNDYVILMLLKDKYDETILTLRQ